MHLKSLFKNITTLAVSMGLNLFAVFADVGNFTSYSGSSSSSSSSSDMGFDILYLLFYTLGFKGLLGVAVVLIIILVVIKKFNLTGTIKDTMGSVAEAAASFQTTTNNFGEMAEQEVLSKISENDQMFDDMNFKGKIASMYVTLQEAWEAKDWKSVRPFETDSLFSTHSNMIQEHIQKGTTNVMDNICVQSVTLSGFEENIHTGVNKIKVKILARQVDYIKDDATGRVINGNPNMPMAALYQWTLIRKIGVDSSRSANRGVDAKKCPNCGAPVSIGMSGNCDYCGSTVSSGDYDWVLAEIQKIR